ncbi:MAG: hypothetical protein IT443_10115, partial [Phycisphaeraceae bacterium]|nr:hypothetical protein [Phycisphaeraceae bacterium]
MQGQQEIVLSDGRRVTVEPIGVDRRSQTLGLLLTGRVDAPAGEVERILEGFGQDKLATCPLWVAKEGGTPRSAVMIMPYPGRTGMVFLPPLGEEENGGITPSPYPLPQRGRGDETGDEHGDLRSPAKQGIAGTPSGVTSGGTSGGGGTSG